MRRLDTRSNSRHRTWKAGGKLLKLVRLSADGWMMRCFLFHNHRAYLGWVNIPKLKSDCEHCPNQLELDNHLNYDLFQVLLMYIS